MVGPGDSRTVTVSAILSNFTGFAASAGADTAAVELGLTASFAELLADELQQSAALPAPPMPPPAATPPAQLYPWVAVPLVVPAAREDRSGRKKRLPPRWDRRSEPASMPGYSPRP